MYQRNRDKEFGTILEFEVHMLFGLFPFGKNLHPEKSPDAMRQMHDQISLVEVEEAVDGACFQPGASGSPPDFDPAKKFMIGKDNQTLPCETKATGNRSFAQADAGFLCFLETIQQFLHAFDGGGIMTSQEDMLIGLQNGAEFS